MHHFSVDRYGLNHLCYAFTRTNHKRLFVFDTHRVIQIKQQEIVITQSNQ